MRKVAVFVEGATEVLLTKALLEVLCAKESVIVEEAPLRGRGVLSLNIIQPQDQSAKAYVLLTDCGNDETVKSKVLDNRGALLKAGYHEILGLRDLYPKNINELSDLQRGLLLHVPTKDIKISLHIAVRETQAWFVQEGKHYQKIDNDLSIELVRANLNFDADVDSAEDLEHPAEFLNKIYKLRGKRYRKTTKTISRTINALDIDRMCLALSSLIPSFEKYIDLLSGALRL